MLCLHGLRHIAATVLALSGNRLELTSKLLGHASAVFTSQTYTHPTETSLTRLEHFARQQFSPPGRIRRHAPSGGGSMGSMDSLATRLAHIAEQDERCRTRHGCLTRCLSLSNMRS